MTKHFELPGNPYSGAAEKSATRMAALNAGQDSSAYATLALAYEQRTLALVEAAKFYATKGNAGANSSNLLLTQAVERMGYEESADGLK